MGQANAQSVLGRIATAGREDHQARAMTLQKAVRVAMAKVADALMDLPLSVIGVVTQSVAGDALNEVLTEDALLLLLDGPRGAQGAIIIDPVLVGGLIQQQTIGSVRSDAGQTRAMTRTDAAICAPLLDSLLEKVAGLVETDEDTELVTGFRFGSKAEDARALDIALDADDYAILRLTLDMARGTRQGEMMLILPKPDPMAHIADCDEPVDGSAVGPSNLTDAVMGVNANLNMVLCRLNLTLGDVQAWKPGMALQMPPGQFPNVQMTTVTGHVVGQGTVGHVDGARAVKPKRVPPHASHPLRRETDKENVDVPDFEGIRVDLTPENTAAPEPVQLGEPMDGHSGDLSQTDDLPDLSAESGGVQAMPDIDLPALDDLPQLADMPELADLSDSQGELPDLPDLPELDDLPDLADFPELARMQAAD